MRLATPETRANVRRRDRARAGSAFALAAPPAGVGVAVFISALARDIGRSSSVERSSLRSVYES